MSALSRRDESKVEKTRATRSKLLKRLATTAYKVTPVTVEEYYQMSITECLDHVLACEKYTSKLSENIDQVIRAGFIFEGATERAPSSGKTASGKALFVAKKSDDDDIVVRDIVVPYTCRYIYGRPRLRRAADRV